MHPLRIRGRTGGKALKSCCFRREERHQNPRSNVVPATLWGQVQDCCPAPHVDGEGNVLVRDRPSVSSSTKCIAHAHPVVDFRAGFQDATRSDKHPGGGNRIAGRNIQLAKLLANRTRPAGKPIQEPLAKGVGSHIPKRRYEVEIDYVVGVKGHSHSMSLAPMAADRLSSSSLIAASTPGIVSSNLCISPACRASGCSSHVVIKVTTVGASRQPVFTT